MTKRKLSGLFFFGLFDILAIGSVVAFLITTIPEMDWSYGRSYTAIGAFLLVILGIFSAFAMFHVQALYPSLDAHVEDGKEVLDDTPKNRKFHKIMNTLKWMSIGGVSLGFVLYVLTQVIFGVN